MPWIADNQLDAYLQQCWHAPYIVVDLLAESATHNDFAYSAIATVTPTGLSGIVSLARPDIRAQFRHAPPIVGFRAQVLHPIAQQHLQIHPMRWGCLALAEQLLGAPSPITRENLAKHYQCPVFALQQPSNTQEWMLRAHATATIFAHQCQALKKNKMITLYKWENACIPAVAHMEYVGMPCDATLWKRAVQHDIQTYQTLHPNHPNAPALHSRIQRWGLPFLKQLDPQGRIHSHYQQIGSKTGRIVCREPPLQALDTNRRACFKPPKGRTFIIGDYQACELHIAALLSQDPNMLHACAQTSDIHTEMARQLFGQHIGPTERNIAKVTSFGLIYGMGRQRLAQVLKCSTAKAENIIQHYQRTFPQLFQYLQQCVAQAQYHLSIRTPLGRVLNFPKAPLPPEHTRLARNMPIQGTSSDMLKIALAKLFSIAFTMKLFWNAQKQQAHWPHTHSKKACSPQDALSFLKVWLLKSISRFVAVGKNRKNMLRSRLH
jgi:hypothetical protein